MGIFKQTALQDFWHWVSQMHHGCLLISPNIISHFQNQPNCSWRNSIEKKRGLPAGWGRHWVIKKMLMWMLKRFHLWPSQALICYPRFHGWIHCISFQIIPNSYSHLDPRLSESHLPTWRRSSSQNWICNHSSRGYVSIFIYIYIHILYMFFQAPMKVRNITKTKKNTGK